MMKPTHKARLKRALAYKQVERLPTQVNYTKRMGEKLAGYLHVAIDELPEHLDNHMIRVDATSERKIRQDGLVVYDWWGVGFDAQEEGYFVAESPLATNKDLEAFPWPDPNDPSLFERTARTITDDQREHFITPNFGFALFERAWALRGFETLLMDMVLDPGFVEELLERITEIQLVLAKRYLDLGVDGGYFGDDYGAQKNMLFSPKTWRKMIKPRLQRIFTPFREAGLPVILHSDGQIAEILPDLVEIGLTCFNPVQPEVIDHAWLKSTFGSRLAYYGGISTQTVLPYGTPEDVKNSVTDCIAGLTSNGSGLFLSPSHRLMSDIPMENVAAMLDAFSQQPE
jgi:uroporphyrinogen decarboxylase